MSNPRPCFCGHPQSDHTGLVPGTFVPCRQCWLTEWPDGDWCSRYLGVPRKEPLRAHVEVSWRQLANLLADYVNVHVYGEAGPSIKNCLSCQGLVRLIERKREHEVQQ